MRTGNPVLGGTAFEQAAYGNQAGVMTVQGTGLKTGVLVILAIAAAAVTWNMVGQADPNTIAVASGGLIAGLVLALVTIFKPTWSPVTAPLYAIAEGLFLGGISAYADTLVRTRFGYEGLVFQAVCLTFGTLFAMLIAYQSGWIKVTEKFRAGLVAATGAVFLVYMLSWVMRFFGTTIPYIHGAGVIGIGFSLVVIVIAALNLVLDFDFIDRGAAAGAPKYMEWYGAFGLMVTLVWLYIEILKLLVKIAAATRD